MIFSDIKFVLGAFCTCHEGYILDQNTMKCIDVRQEQCYDAFNREQCSEPRGMSITAKECCCSKGAAWGNYCERCPPEGSRKYKYSLNISSLYIFLYSLSFLSLRFAFVRTFMLICQCDSWYILRFCFEGMKIQMADSLSRINRDGRILLFMNGFIPS